MTKLMREIAKDPDATWQVEIDLPSGNMAIGTIGPLINGRLCASVTFRQQDASEADVKFAHEALNFVIGKPEAFVNVSRTAEERKKSITEVKKFFGGGNG